MAFTQYQPHGQPGRRYGSFAGKEASSGSHPVGRITQYAPHGMPGRRYGSFAGKETAVGGPHPVGRLTQYACHGMPMRVYGSFAGKELSVISAARRQYFVQIPYNMARVRRRRR